MNESTLKMIEELAQMDEKERESVLKQIVKNDDMETTQKQAALADETEQENIDNEMAEDVQTEDIEKCEENDTAEYSSYDDGFTKEDYVVGGILLAGAGIAAGMLGLLLDNKTLKTTGLVGTVLGGAVVIANKN